MNSCSRNRERASHRTQQLARGLGWFSIGLGVTELVAPDFVSRIAGSTDGKKIIRACGAREIVTGAGLLTARRKSGWLWARVAGDALDLALLGPGIKRPWTRNRALGAAAAVAGVTMLDVIASRKQSEVESESRDGRTAAGKIHFRQSIIIDRSAEDLYKFWRQLENLPRIMQHLESVRATDGNRSRWVAKGPAGTTVEWDAQITDDEPNKIIAWTSVAGSEIENRGSVHFCERAGWAWYANFCRH